MASAESLGLQRTLAFVNAFQQLPRLVPNGDDEPTAQLQLVNQLEGDFRRSRPNQNSLIGGGPRPSCLRRREHDVHIVTPQRVKIAASTVCEVRVRDDRIDFGSKVAERDCRVGRRRTDFQHALPANELQRVDHGRHRQALRRRARSSNGVHVPRPEQGPYLEPGRPPPRKSKWFDASAQH